MARFLIIICLLFPFFALAEEGAKSWQMEDADSTIKFSVVIEGGPSEGEFTKFTADIQFDREKLDQSHLDIIIDLSQIDSFYDDVSTNLVKKDWFDVVRFPTGRFVSREFKHIDSNNYQVTGDMTLRDVTKSETLHFALTEYGEHQASIIGKMTLNRLDYGVGQGVWSDITSVGGKVFLSVVVKATR